MPSKQPSSHNGANTEAHLNYDPVETIQKTEVPEEEASTTSVAYLVATVLLALLIAVWAYLPKKRSDNQHQQALPSMVTVVFSTMGHNNSDDKECAVCLCPPEHPEVLPCHCTHLP